MKLPESSSERLIAYLRERFGQGFSGEFYIKTHEGGIRDFHETVRPRFMELDTQSLTASADRK